MRKDENARVMEKMKTPNTRHSATLRLGFTVSVFAKRIDASLDAQQMFQDMLNKSIRKS